jgi:hypothetical protein
MGSFYTNVTLRGSRQDTVVEALHGREAYVTQAFGEYTVVYDAECEEQDPEVLTALAAGLSAELECPALAVINHDDDVLAYWLYVNGSLEDEYNSMPDYFKGLEEPTAPAGGVAARLTSLFGGDAEVVERILRAGSVDDEGYVFALDRHADLVEELGLPACAVGYGYTYMEEGELPEELDEDQLRKVG